MCDLSACIQKDTGRNLFSPCALTVLCFPLFSPNKADVQLNGKKGKKKCSVVAFGRVKLVKMLIWFFVGSVNHPREL